MRNAISVLFVSSALAMVAVVPGRAADLAASPGPDFAGETAATPSGWTFTIAPYLFAAGLSGQVAQFGAPPVNVSLDFGDILNHLKFGGMAVSEARNGRFGIFTDVMYAKIGESVTGPGPFGVTVGLTTSTFTGTAMGEYRIVQSAAGSLDAMAGLRVWDAGSDLAFSGGPLGGRKFEDGRTWVDPMIGAKGRLNLGGRFYLAGWGMIGGFDVSSKLDWDLSGGIGYDVSKRFSLIAGYRAVGVDYKNGPFVFNVVQQGPIIGGAIRF